MNQNKQEPTLSLETERELNEILELNNPEGSYIHVLTRVKSSRHFGTMSIDDFEEISDGDEFVTDLKNLVAKVEQRAVTTTLERVEKLLEDETTIKMMEEDEKNGLNRYYILSANQKRRNELRAEQRQALTTLKQELLGKDI